MIVEREAPGGQAALSSRIENYLGFPSGLSGADLARRAVAQARRFGTEILAPQEVTKVRSEGPYRIVTLSDGSELSCHAMMIATGVQWRKLNIPGIDRLQGAGVYYGAGSTEALSCRDEDVYIIGGANSAGQAAMNFSRYARNVVMLVRGDNLGATMSQYLINDIAQTPNIRVEYGMEVVAVHGEEKLEADFDLLQPDRNRGYRARDRAIRFYRRGAAYGLAGRICRARRPWLSAYRAGSDARWQTAAGLDRGPRPLHARNERARRVCRGGCPPWFGEAGRIRSGRRLDRHSIRTQPSG